jgi:hypothetical protein
MNWWQPACLGIAITSFVMQFLLWSWLFVRHGYFPHRDRRIIALGIVTLVAFGLGVLT